MKENLIYSINGPVVKVKDTDAFSMLEMVYVGNSKLMGEVISITKEFTTIQVYETTTGLKPGEPVFPTGQPISVTLGPGILRNIYDGIERPLEGMAYENDIIMRQVRDMTRMLAKILFGKNTATYEYKEEDRHTATDSLYARLIALVDAGKINEAENRLYEELERDEEGTFEVALGFYDYLNELPEEFLEEHDYSKEEVKEGAQSLADRKGLGLLGEGLD